MKFKVGDKVKNIINGNIGEIVNVDERYEVDKLSGIFTHCYHVRYDKHWAWNTIVEIEKVPEILDKEEKEYLRNVIKPFRNDIKSIVKEENLEHYYIRIDLKHLDVVNLPNFCKSKNMYKGMVANKKYTLKDLDL